MVFLSRLSHLFFRWLRLGGMVHGLLLSPLLVAAPNVELRTEPELKAAFILNFLQFVSFPAGIPPQWRICISQRSAIGDALERISSNKIRDRNVVIQSLVPANKAAGCHIYLISDEERNALTETLSQLKSLPILSIADIESGAQLGAGISFVTREEGRIGFDISLQMTRQQKLDLSSHLLRLARRVY